MAVGQSDERESLCNIRLSNFMTVNDDMHSITSQYYLTIFSVEPALCD